MGVRWKQAKEWITRPEPEYAWNNEGRLIVHEGDRSGAPTLLQRVAQTARSRIVRESRLAVRPPCSHEMRRRLDQPCHFQHQAYPSTAGLRGRCRVRPESAGPVDQARQYE